MKTKATFDSKMRITVSRMAKSGRLILASGILPAWFLLLAVSPSGGVEVSSRTANDLAKKYVVLAGLAQPNIGIVSTRPRTNSFGGKYWEVYTANEYLLTIDAKTGALRSLHNEGLARRKIKEPRTLPSKNALKNPTEAKMRILRIAGK